MQLSWCTCCLLCIQLTWASNLVHYLALIILNDPLSTHELCLLIPADLATTYPEIMSDSGR